MITCDHCGHKFDLNDANLGAIKLPHIMIINGVKEYRNVFCPNCGERKIGKKVMQ